MRALLIALGLLVSGPVASQTLSVRGGEHQGFSRLVLPVPAGVAWSFAPAPGGYELRLPPEVSFDLDRAFERIPRDRVAALTTPGDGRLGLAVNCNCHAQAYAFDRVGLVIDVIDGPPLLDGFAPGGPLVAFRSSSLLLSAPGMLGSVPEPLTRFDLGLTQQFDTEQGAGPERAEAGRVADTRQAMLEGVATAATQGLLDFAPGVRRPNMQDGDSAHPQDVVENGPDRTSGGGAVPSLRGGPELPPLTVGPGLAFHDATEIEASKPQTGTTGSACLDDEAFDLAAWSGSGDYATETAARLARITDERDRLDPEAIRALAQSYIAFGFGREALGALDLDGVSSRERDLLRLLARVIDGDPAPWDVLGTQAGCVGAVAFWRALANGSIRATDERERTAMMLALKALPDGLRSHLAPQLAGLFLDAGDTLSAEEIARLGAEHTDPETQLLHVAILEETQGPAPALNKLQSIAEADSRLTPEIMLNLIDLSIREGRLISEDTLELARSLRFEYGGADARRLLIAEARALSAKGHFEEALALLTEERRVRPSDDLDEAMSDVALALTESLGDAAFLELALGRLPADLPRPAHEMVAQRIERLGFPAGARPFGPRAEDPSSGHPDPNRLHPIMTPADAMHQQAEPSSTLGGSVMELPAPLLREVVDRIDTLAESGPVRPANEEDLLALSVPNLELGTASAGLMGDSSPSRPMPAPVLPIGGDAAAALPSNNVTLADRRALLERAGEARTRAAALLEQTTVE